MPRRTTALLGPLVAAALALPTSALLPTAPAAAATVEPALLGMTPATGSAETVPDFTTSAPCPAGTDETYVQLRGGRFPEEGQVVRDISPFGSTSRPFLLRSSRSLQATALDARFVDLDGAYRAELVCATRLGERLGVFRTTFTVTSGRYAVDSSPVPSAPAAGRLDGQPVSLDAVPPPGAGGAAAGSTPAAPSGTVTSGGPAAPAQQDAPADSPTTTAAGAPAGPPAGGGDRSVLLGALLGGGAVAAGTLLVVALRRAGQVRGGAGRSVAATAPR